jgi:uncharacterized protein (TIGR00255 family)
MKRKKMIASMTGFGRAEESFENGSLIVEIRSVNHRFIDFSIRLPRSLADFEIRIKELIKRKIQRGYVTYQLTWGKEQDDNDSLVLNEAKIHRYQELFRRMKDEFGIEGSASVDTFIHLSDVFKAEIEPEDQEKIWPAVEKATLQALEALFDMRHREGEVLSADIVKRLENMADCMKKANLRAPERLEKLGGRLREKIRTALDNDAVDENRMITEITIYADRWDFSEEDVRFRSHLEAMRQDLQAGGAVGRKLSFMLQELNREVNTIASKANDSEIAQIMVTIKEEIEKVREQVENIE